MLITTTSLGEYQISGMREPTSVYNDESYPDPYPNSTTRFTIPSLSTTISSYRSDSAVPDSLQWYITAVVEALAMRSVPVTRSMVRETPLTRSIAETILPPFTPPTTLPAVINGPISLSRSTSTDSFDAVESDTEEAA